MLDGSDVNVIREKTQALNEAAQPLAQALYADSSASARRCSGSDNGEAAATEDEVVEDADFEVIDEDETAKKA